MVEQSKVNYIHFVQFCFIVAGHTEFTLNHLFAQVTNSYMYNRGNVFTILQFMKICNLHTETTVDDGLNVLQWQETLSMKYSGLPG